MAFLLRVALWLARHRLPRLAMAVARCASLHRPDEVAAFRLRIELALDLGDHAYAERSCHARLALNAEDPDALRGLGHAALGRGKIIHAVDCFRRLDALEGRHDCVTQAYTRQHLDISRAQRGEPYCRWLDHVCAETSYWTIMKDGVIYNDDVHAKDLYTSPFVQGRISADGTTVIATLPPPREEITEACIYVGGDDNYSHWLFRNMLKLSTLDRAGQLFDYPWLVNNDLRGYQTDYIGMLGQRPERLIRVERHTVILCRRVLVPALLISSGAVTQGVQWIRERFAHLLASGADATHRVFVSRRDNSRRSLLNEDELFESLAPLGFVRIVPGEMSAQDQVAAFSGASVIVAAHGAALTNMIFAPPSATIVRITSTAIDHMTLFRKLARSTRQTVVTIRSDDYPVPAHEVEVNTPYRVDPKAVMRAVRQLL